MYCTPEFERAFELVIGSEGGYVNDPNDPGGETKYGVSKRAYPSVDIKNLSLDGAKDIYWRDYWAKLSLDKLPWSIAYPAFDTAVNLGVYATSGMLKSALATKNPPRYLLSLRLKHYRRLSTFPIYGDGWMDRVVGVALEAH